YHVRAVKDNYVEIMWQEEEAEMYYDAEVKIENPEDADIMFDVRFLPNPFYVEQMRPLTGQDKEVSDYVFKWSETKTFNQKLIELLHFTIPFYKKEGKSQIVIAIGCTGGQHRSVAL